MEMTPKSIRVMKVSEVTTDTAPPPHCQTKQKDLSAVMKTLLYSLCMCLLLLSSLCPRTLCKSGRLFWGKSKGEGNKESLQNKGLTKQGLRVVGAVAAAGILGGTGTGYGLGFLGKGKKKSGPKTVSSNQHMYHKEGQRPEDQSQWNAAAPVLNNSVFLLSLVPVLIIWIRNP